MKRIAGVFFVLCTSCIDYAYNKIEIPVDKLSEVETAMRVVERVLEKSTIDSAAVLRERFDAEMEHWRIVHPGSDSTVVANEQLENLTNETALRYVKSVECNSSGDFMINERSAGKVEDEFEADLFRVVRNGWKKLLEL